MKIRDLFDQLPVLDRANWHPNHTVNKITCDSRAVEPGDVFVACQGSLMDGHDFMGQAVMANAGAIVYEKTPRFPIPSKVTAIRVQNSHEALSQLIRRYYGYPDQNVKLVGITGTNGKTTIAYLLHRLLREKTPAAYIGTLWYELPGQKHPALNTTPPAEVLLPLLGEMSREKVGHCIMEVSSHALDQRRVHGLQFELAIFTQLTQDHLDYHEDMESYFLSKKRLFNESPKPKLILSNKDCPYGQRILSGHRNSKLYSLKGPADYWASDIESSFQGSRFRLKFKGRDIPFQIRLPMKHNVANVVAVLAALDLMGFDPEDFRGALQEIPGIPGRMERVMGADAFQVFVDYAHTPDAVENVLAEAKLMKPRRILTLLGCGGDRDRGKRALMARAACRYSDVLVLTSDNPRSEDPEMILRDLKKGIPASFSETGKVFEQLDRRVAIETLISQAEPDDVLFVLGKGHENYQILGERKIPFDDRLVVQECLKRKSRVFFS